MSFLGRILSGTSPKLAEDSQEKRIIAVELICDRMLTASLLEDRRAAAQALKSVSKHYQPEVGTVALQTIVTALKRDNEDSETVKCLVESVIAICSEGVQFRREYGEVFMKEQESIRILLDCLQDSSQTVRFSILQLLVLLEEMISSKLAEAILAFPAGLSRLLDLLEDSRDIIRVEAISLLCHLTASSIEFQKIAMFEGAFERMFELIFSEGGVYGGEVIVQDALLIIQNLLRHNPPNQNYFRESPYFKKLAMLLDPTPLRSPPEWNPNIIASFQEAVEIPCILLHRDNTRLGQVQAELLEIGLFEALIMHALGSDTPKLVKSISLRALDLLIWYNSVARTKLARHVITEGKRPIPAILAVIIMAIDGGPESLALRSAASDMIGSYLSDNVEGQVVIASTFKSPRLPASPGHCNNSAGSVLIERAVHASGVRKDPHCIWFPVTILCHVLRDNSQCKMIALNHQISLEADGEDTADNCMSLMAVVTQRLVSCVHDPKQLQSSLAYLMLLATWLFSYPPAVEAFISQGSNISLGMRPIFLDCWSCSMRPRWARFLGTVVRAGILTLPRKNLQDIVTSRIGFDVFSARIIRTRDWLNTSLLTQEPEKTVFDRAFAELYLDTYDSILRLFQAVRHGRPSHHASPATIRHVDTSIETDSDPASSMPTNNVSYFDFESAQSEILDADHSQQLLKENIRLQRTIDMYAAQLLQVEKDHEELLICLASYDSELKQLRQHLAIAEQQRDSISLHTFHTNSDVRLTHLNGSPQGGELGGEIDLPAGQLYRNPPGASETTQSVEDNLISPVTMRFGAFLQDTNPSTNTFDV